MFTDLIFFSDGFSFCCFLILFCLLPASREDQFVQAAASGDLEGVKRFLSSGIDINCVNSVSGLGFFIG